MTAATARRAVLALNTGSSSLKFGLYAFGADGLQLPTPILSGEAEPIGACPGEFWIKDAHGATLIAEAVRFENHEAAMARIGTAIAARADVRLAAVGHRVVHGGPDLRRHCRIDATVLQKLQAASVFAPLHTPPALSVIGIAQQQFPGLPQVACFDTTFHTTLPDVARTLPIPLELQTVGIQRYGFHGLSCASIVRQLATDLPERLIIAHLGNGASLTAVKNGRSIDTSMGLTPAGGVIMGTRSGDIDPGVLVFLARDWHLDAAGLEDLVNHKSGLLGISGISSDMRRLHEASSSDVNAHLAIEMFCYSIRKQIGALAAALDGVDLLVFTGGIGEHDAKARDMICDGLAWLGIDIDPADSNSLRSAHSPAARRGRVRVLPSDEETEIAIHTVALATGAS